MTEYLHGLVEILELLVAVFSNLFVLFLGVFLVPAGLLGILWFTSSLDDLIVSWRNDPVPVEKLPSSEDVVEFRGKAYSKNGDRIEAPISGERCVACSFQVHQSELALVTGKVSKKFIVSDDGHRVEIDPKYATFSFGDHETVLTLSPGQRLPENVLSRVIDYIVAGFQNPYSTITLEQVKETFAESGYDIDPYVEKTDDGIYGSGRRDLEELCSGLRRDGFWEILPRDGETDGEWKYEERYLKEGDVVYVFGAEVVESGGVRENAKVAHSRENVSYHIVKGDESETIRTIAKKTTLYGVLSILSILFGFALLAIPISNYTRFEVSTVEVLITTVSTISVFFVLSFYTGSVYLE